MCKRQAVVVVAVVGMLVCSASGLASAQDLNVSLNVPSSTDVDEPTSLSAEITTPDLLEDFEGDMTATLVIDGSETDAKTFSMQDGATKTVTFEHTFDESGEKTVTIKASLSLAGQTFSDSASTTLDVEALIPDRLLLSSSIPSESELGETVPIDGTLSASEVGGSIAGEGTVDLVIDGTTVETLSISLADGDSAPVNFEPIIDDPGEHNVSVEANVKFGDKTLSASTSQTVEVLRGIPETITTSLWTPSSAEYGESIDINGSIEVPDVNGSITGEGTIELVVDGTPVETISIAVADGESTPVSFETSFESTGVRNVSLLTNVVINNQTLTANTSETLDVSGTVPEQITTSLSAPSGVTAGKSVEINGTIDVPAVPGTVTGSGTVELTVAGDTVEQRSITVTDGESVPVSFSHSFESAGDQDVAISGSVTIENRTLTTFSESTVSVSESTTAVPSSISLLASVPDTVQPEVEFPVAGAVSAPDVDGSVTGTGMVSVTANGEEIASQEINLTDGSTRDFVLRTVLTREGETELTVRTTVAIGDTELSANRSYTINVTGSQMTPIETATFTATPTDSPTPTQSAGTPTTTVVTPTTTGTVTTPPTGTDTTLTTETDSTPPTETETTLTTETDWTSPTETDSTLTTTGGTSTDETSPADPGTPTESAPNDGRLDTGTATAGSPGGQTAAETPTDSTEMTTTETTTPSSPGFGFVVGGVTLLALVVLRSSARSNRG